MDVDKKLKVFEVAKELFERFGYKKTTVDEIAANAGISKKTLYEIFAGKEKLLSELVIPAPPGQEAQAQAIAQRLSETVRSEAQFAAAARQYSAVPTAPEGGRLPVRSRYIIVWMPTIWNICVFMGTWPRPAGVPPVAPRRGVGGQPRQDRDGGAGAGALQNYSFVDTAPGPTFP